MPEELMSDARQQELFKAAEETIGLMNIGITPDAALTKVAQDKMLNDHEVDVVAHAVNNSKQLSYLQNNKGADREGEFPLIDPENVRAYGECQPTTNADDNTGDRYGMQETPGDNAEAKMDAPDAVETQDKIEKDAADGDFRLRPEAVDHAAILREGWGLTEGAPKFAEYQDPNPFAKVDYVRIGIEEADRKGLEKMSECTDILVALGDKLRQPANMGLWPDIEKTAAALGAEKATLDLTFAQAGLEKFDVPRCDFSIKTASSRIYVTSEVKALAEEIVRADTFWKQAADYYAAGASLRERKEAGESALFPKVSAISPIAGGSSSLGDFAEPIEKAPEDFGGLNTEVIQQAIGGGEAPSLAGPIEPDQGVRQELKNMDARSALEGLMSDDYIGGYSTPEVVEAYNAAMSVNPNFGQAELVSYVRQHLATQGGVPLDMQIRARGKDKD